MAAPIYLSVLGTRRSGTSSLSVNVSASNRLTTLLAGVETPCFFCTRPMVRSDKVAARGEDSLKNKSSMRNAGREILLAFRRLRGDSIMHSQMEQ